MLDGKEIRVDFSFTRKPHEPTPGVYLGREKERRGGGSDRFDRDHRGRMDRGGSDRFR